MITLQWGLRKAHVWLDSLPNWDSRSSNIIKRQREVSTSSIEGARSAALEFLVPVGPRAHYGALGAAFTPANTGQLVVTVPVSNVEGKLLADSLAGRLDTVRLGLPLEYLEGVFAGGLSTGAVLLLGAGTLDFCCAAHGSLGSSVWFFQVLSGALVRLLCLDRTAVSEAGLIDLLQDELSRHPSK